MGTQHLPKSELTKRGRHVGLSNRNADLHVAWANSEWLKDEHRAGKPIAEIAKENCITLRAAYRIIRGK